MSPRWRDCDPEARAWLLELMGDLEGDERYASANSDCDSLQYAARADACAALIRLAREDETPTPAEHGMTLDEALGNTNEVPSAYTTARCPRCGSCKCLKETQGDEPEPLF